MSTTLLRRRSFPFYIRYPALAFAYGLGLPLIKLLEAGGLMPRLADHMQNQANRRLGSFGAYQPTANDVLVCSYFKSGTNWMMHLSLQVAWRGRAEFDHIHDLIPWPDAFNPRYAVPLTPPPTQTSPTGLRVIKTHLALDAVPYTPAARYICVVRDPKEVFVSSYHFARSVMLGPMMPSVASWLDLFLSGNFMFGSWGHHLQTAWEMRHRPNALFFTYTELKADLAGAVRRVTELLGVDLTPEEQQAVWRLASFDYMKTIDHKFYPGALMPWTGAGGRMMRRGQAGGSGEMLTPAQQQRIDDYWRTTLKKQGCDFPYDAVFARG